MSEERAPNTEYGGEASDQGWDSVVGADFDDSDCDTVLDLQESKAMYGEEAEDSDVDSASWQAGEDIAAMSVTSTNDDECFEGQIAESVDMEHLLLLEKESIGTEHNLGDDPPITSNSSIIMTDNAPTTAPFNPPGLILPTSSSILELKPSNPLDDCGLINSNLIYTEANIMGIPVLLRTAELTQGELWLYGERSLALYRCKSPSPLRISWTSIYV